VKTVYPPVSLRSLGGYKDIQHFKNISEQSDYKIVSNRRTV